MPDTERLLLRRFKAADLNDLYELMSDEENIALLPGEPLSFNDTCEELVKRMKSDEYYAIVLKNSTRVIGSIRLARKSCLNRELDIIIDRKHQRQLYGYEACSVLISEAFAEGAHRIYSVGCPENTAGVALLKKLGFVCEAHLKSNVYYECDENGRPLWKDTSVYAMLNPNE